MIIIEGINHFGITVSNLDNSIQFYSELFDFEVMEKNANQAVIKTIIPELNNREILMWSKIKNSDTGWIDDETLFALIDYDLGADYHWKTVAEIDGGKLYFKGEEIKLDRIGSTIRSPAKWEFGGKKIE